jgi:DNA-binding FrmR family transcriptional regulator
MNGLTAELIEDHLHHHVVEPSDEAGRLRGADELVDVVRTYLR